MSSASSSDIRSLLSRRNDIEGPLLEFLDEQSAQYPLYSWGKDLFEEFKKTIVKGKMFRGILFWETYRAISEVNPRSYDKAYREEVALHLAMALELFGYSILVQDDVQDQSPLRRGDVTFHLRFAERAAAEGLKEPDHTGESTATVMGDIGFFLTSRLITRAALQPRVEHNVRETMTDITTLLGLAQIEDNRMGAISDLAAVRPEEYREMCLGKTSSYTWVWPLLWAAHAADRPDLIEPFTQLGEQAGLIFQLKDDDLDLFGETDDTGKVNGADVLEGKKTLHAIYALDALTGEDKVRFLSLYGDADLDESEVHEAIELIEDSGARQRVLDEIGSLAENCMKSISSIKMPESSKEILQTVLIFNRERSR